MPALNHRDAHCLKSSICPKTLALRTCRLSTLLAAAAQGLLLSEAAYLTWLFCGGVGAGGALCGESDGWTPELEDDENRGVINKTL